MSHLRGEGHGVATAGGGVGDPVVCEGRHQPGSPLVVAIAVAELTVGTPAPGEQPGEEPSQSNGGASLANFSTNIPR